MKFYKYINTIPAAPSEGSFEPGDEIKVRKGSGSEASPYYWNLYKVAASGSIDFVRGITDDQNTRLERLSSDQISKVESITTGDIIKLKEDYTKAEIDQQLEDVRNFANSSRINLNGSTVLPVPPRRPDNTVIEDAWVRLAQNVTYTQAGGSPLTGIEGHETVAEWNNEDGEWVLVDMGELPQVDTDNLIKDEDLDLVQGNQLFNGQKITGFYINLNGDITPYADGSYGIVDLSDKGNSKYITINGLPFNNTLARYYAFQNVSGTVLQHGRLDPAEPRTLSIPDTAVKFLFTIDVVSSVIDPQTIMINYGGAAKEWEPYIAAVEKIKNHTLRYPVFSKRQIKTKNLFSDSNVEYFALVITTTGLLAKASVNWNAAWKIPTEGNSHIYINNLNTSASPSVVSFFTGPVPTESTFTTNQYDDVLLAKVSFTKTNGSASIEIPTGATWFAINIKTNSEDISVYKDLFISYTPIDNDDPIRDEEFISKIDNQGIASEAILYGDKVISSNNLALKSDISTNSDVTLLKDGYNLAIRIPFNSNEDLVHRWQQKNANGVFNSLGVYSVNKTTSDDEILSVGTIVHLFSDNIAPIFFKTLVTATGNHGVALPIATVSGGAR